MVLLDVECFNSDREWCKKILIFECISSNIAMAAKYTKLYCDYKCTI